MKKFIYLILILYLIGISKTVAQSDSSRYKFIGGSTQVYPAGIIAAVHTEIFYNTYTSLFFKAGGNFANRKDFGSYNDNEKGNGIGASAAYRKHINLKRVRYFLVQILMFGICGLIGRII